MTITVSARASRPPHSTKIAVTPGSYFPSRTMVGSCPEDTVEYDCPFCSGPETD